LLTIDLDSLAGQMQALRHGKKVLEDDESDGSNTEGDDDDDTSETDTDTDSDED
jgi:translocation protein SEC63